MVLFADYRLDWNLIQCQNSFDLFDYFFCYYTRPTAVTSAASTAVSTNSGWSAPSYHLLVSHFSGFDYLVVRASLNFNLLNSSGSRFAAVSGLGSTEFISANHRCWRWSTRSSGLSGRFFSLCFRTADHYLPVNFVARSKCFVAIFVTHYYLLSNFHSVYSYLILYDANWLEISFLFLIKTFVLISGPPFSIFAKYYFEFCGF